MYNGKIECKNKLNASTMKQFVSNRCDGFVQNDNGKHGNQMLYSCLNAVLVCVSLFKYEKRYVLHHIFTQSKEHTWISINPVSY